MDKNFDGLIAENNRRGEQIVSLQNELARSRETIEIVAAQRNRALEAVDKLRESVDKFIMAKNLPGDHCEMDQAEIFGIEALAATEPATVDLPKCDRCGASCGTDCDGSSHYAPEKKE